MAIKPKRCPNCEAALQPLLTAEGTHYVCRCGHGEDHALKEDIKGLLAYVQSVGNRSLTRLQAKPQRH